MSEWRKTTWGEISTLSYGKALRGAELNGGDVRVFGTNGPIGWHDKALFPAGVVVGRKGAYRGIHYSDGPCWVIDTAFFLDGLNPEVVDPRWAFYQLRTVDLDSIDSGSAIPSTTRPAFAAIPLRLPTLREQELQVEVLQSVDELIKNTRRRIKVLEEMAQAIYREWFLHFRYPGHEDATFVDSTLGPIPEGWDETTLGNCAKWLSGGTPKTKVPEYWSGDIPWITSGTLTSMLLDRSERMITPLGAANGTRIVPRDALLFVVRGMSLVREFRVGIADRELAFGQDCKALIANPDVAPLYLGFAVISMADDIQNMTELAGHGTGKLSTDRLQKIEIPLPPHSVQQRFVNVVTPMRESMTALRLAADHLVMKRNLLLPRLVTGEIDLSGLDLDALVGAAW